MTYDRAIEPKERGALLLALGDGLAVARADDLYSRARSLLEVVCPDDLARGQLDHPVLRRADSLTAGLNDDRPIELGTAGGNPDAGLFVQCADPDHVTRAAGVSVNQVQCGRHAGGARVVERGDEAEMHLVVSPRALEVLEAEASRRNDHAAAIDNRASAGEQVGCRIGTEALRGERELPDRLTVPRDFVDLLRGRGIANHKDGGGVGHAQVSCLRARAYGRCRMGPANAPDQRKRGDHQGRDQNSRDARGPLRPVTDMLPCSQRILHQPVARVADLTERRLLPVESGPDVVTESHQMSSSRSPGRKRWQAL